MQPPDGLLIRPFKHILGNQHFMLMEKETFGPQMLTKSF